MLDDWPHRFEQFLDVFQTVTKHRTSATGVGRSFGTLLRKAHWFEQQGYVLTDSTAVWDNGSKSLFTKIKLLARSETIPFLAVITAIPCRVSALCNRRSQQPTKLANR